MNSHPKLLMPKVAVVAKDISALKSIGKIFSIPRISDALVFAPNERLDEGPVCLWAKASYGNYREAWETAASIGSLNKIGVFHIGEYGDNIDVDHVYPRSWALHNGMSNYWLRLFPIYGEINRSAGAGIEKNTPINRMPAHGVIWATEYQILKMISHPVGTPKTRLEAIFDFSG